jgi:CubicO group peptidase (beta-lactamase class C family)
MKAAPTPRTLANWDSAPWNRVSFRTVREILPTVEVWRGAGPAAHLVENKQELGDLVFTGTEGETTIDAFLTSSFTDGFLILHRGKRVFERYQDGMSERCLHLSQSVAKSLVGALAGVLVGEGLVNVDQQITRYLPELGDTAYRGATVRHLLDMTSGVAFNEDYTDPHSDIAKVDVASGWKPRPATGAWPDSIFDVIKSLKTLTRPHGEAFSYRSIETDVLAFVLEKAAGMRLAALLSDRIWSHIGAEESANFTVDPSGYALADGGFNATLRDYARFGQMIFDGGSAMGNQIVPESWIADTRRADHHKFHHPYTIVTPSGGYRNQFWSEDVSQPTLLCRGVFGQMIFIAPQYEMVGVKLSSWPDFVNPKRTMTTLASMHAIGRALTMPTKG